MRERALEKCRKHWQSVLSGCVLLTLALSLCAETQRLSDIAIDESEWVTAGYVAWQLLCEGAPPERWATAFAERRLGDWGINNPPVGKYVIGLAITAQVTDDSAVDYHWEFAPRHDGHAPERKPPPLALLTRARQAIALCAGLALLGVYFVAYELCGARLWALVAALALFLLPNFQHHAVHVYTDAPQVALMAWATYGLMCFARTQRTAALVASLVCAGLACAVKLSAGTLCLATCFYLGSLALAQRRSLVPFALSCTVPFAVFVAVNPYLYDGPLRRTLQIAQAWSGRKAAQQLDEQLAPGAVTTVLRRFELVSARGLFAPSQIVHMNSLALNALASALVPLLVVAAIGAGSLWLTGQRIRLRTGIKRLLRLLVWFALGSLLELMLSAHATWYGGLAAMGLGCLIGHSVQRPGARAFAHAWFWTWLATSVWLPFDWSRYYLPLVSLSVVAIALACAELAACFELSAKPALLPAGSLSAGLAWGVAALALIAFGCTWLTVVMPPLLPNQ